MKYIFLIYNPGAGKRSFKNYLDYFCAVAKGIGYDVMMCRLTQEENLVERFQSLDASLCQAIIVAGGDGTVNKVVNDLIRSGRDIPVGIIPAGTANDFAVYLRMPKDIKAAIGLLPKLKAQSVDVGEVNGHYFINVCAGGGLVNISHYVDQELKNNIGVLAYYLRGLTEMTTLKSRRFHIETKDGAMIEELLFFLLINTTGSGGFTDLVLDARINDGFLDFIGFKPSGIPELTNLISKMLTGQDFTNEKNILYFRTDHLMIDCLDPIDHSNVDGEIGPSFPLTINVHPLHIRVMTAGSNL